MNITLSKFLSASLLLGTLTTAVVASNSATAQPLYWQPWAPDLVNPGFSNLPPSIIVGGWWNSPDYGRSDIRICRLSDNLGSWSYGSFHMGRCHYYSRATRRGVAIGIGFDLLGGYPQPLWISGNNRFYDRLTHTMGAPSLPNGQQIAAQQTELESLCRIMQPDGAFIGTLSDGACFAAWQGSELISADYEVIDSEIP